MKIITILTIISIIPNLLLSNNLELPEPAPSFWAIENLGLNISVENKPPGLKDVSLLYKSGRKTLIVYKDGDKYYGFDAFEATWYSQEKISESKILIKDDIAILVINLWVDWLSRATYGSQEINFKMFGYAAASRSSENIYEGIFVIGYDPESYTHKMRHLLSQFSGYMSKIELLTKSDDEIEKMTISRTELDELVAQYEKDIIQLVAALRQIFDEHAKDQ